MKSRLRSFQGLVGTTSLSSHRVASNAKREGTPSFPQSLCILSREEICDVRMEVFLIRLNTAQRLALNLDSHIVIDAGAGTGKTSTIVDRVIEHYLANDQRATESSQSQPGHQV